MKIGFNEGCNRFCETIRTRRPRPVRRSTALTTSDIQSECLDREIAAGKYTIDDLGAWFADPSIT